MFLLTHSDTLCMECDVLLTCEQVGEAQAPSSMDDSFVGQRTSVPIGFVVSVSPLIRPYKVWYKQGQPESTPFLQLSFDAFRYVLRW